MTEPTRNARRWPRSLGARCALWTLLALVASAVYAPFLASAAPLYLRGLDVRALRSASAALPALAREWRESFVELDPGAGRAPRRAEALASLQLRFELLERCLDPRSDLAARVERAAQAVDSLSGAPRGAASTQLDTPLDTRLDGALRELDALAEAVDAALVGVASPSRSNDASKPAAPASSAPSDAADARTAGPPAPWRTSASWPLFAALSFWSWWFALLLPLAAWAVLHGLSARAAALAFGALSFVAVALTLGLRAAPGLATRDVKLAIVAGDVLVERALFAPVPYGFDETRLGEALRPPTWLPSAELDAQGRYVRGARADAAGAARPVEVRAGEPSLNCWRRHLLGADSLGRDVLARVLWGGRVSLGVAFAAVLALLAFGIVAGLLAGVSRGAFDTLFLFVAQTLQSFPSLFLILVAVALLPAHGVHPQVATALVIAAVSWTGVARLVRAQVRAVREREWVLAARASGLSPARVLFAHIAPNALAPALVSGAFALGGAVLAESATSFLGFGVQPPVPSWGAVLRESSAVEHAWILLGPGLLVFAAVASANALGDALRERLELREAA